MTGPALRWLSNALADRAQLGFRCGGALVPRDLDLVTLEQQAQLRIGRLTGGE